MKRPKHTCSADTPGGAQSAPQRRPNAFDGPESPKSPLPARKSQAGGSEVGKNYFLPWFFTASIAAAAASGSR